MDVGQLTAVMPQSGSGLGSVKAANTGNTGFGIVLGSILGGNMDPATQSNQQENPAVSQDGLTALLQALTNEDASPIVALSEENLDLEQIDEAIEEKFPELIDWLGELMTVLTGIINQNPDANTGNTASSSQSEQITAIDLESLKNALSEKQFTNAIAQTLELLGKMEPAQLQGLAGDKIAQLMTAAKVLERMPQTANVMPQAMNELEGAVQSLHKLTNKLEEWSKESRFQSLIAETTHSDAKAKPIPVPQLPAMNLILKKPISMEAHSVTAVEEVKPGDIVQPAQHQMTRIEQFSLHVNEKLAPETRMNEFIKEFNSILARSSLTQGAGGTKLLIKLYPEHLGQLRVELLQKDGMMMARLVASSNSAKDMLDSQLHSLRQAFTQQNIQVDKVEVIYPQGEAQKYTNQDGRSGQQQQNSQQQTDKREMHNEQEQDFHETLNSMLFQSEA